MPHLEYILTFDTGNQVVESVDLYVENFREVFATKAKAVAWFKNRVKHFRRHLLKVSMCFYGSDNPAELPAWYMDCDGKLWDDDLGTQEWNPYR